MTSGDVPAVPPASSRRSSGSASPPPSSPNRHPRPSPAPRARHRRPRPQGQGRLGLDGLLRRRRRRGRPRAGARREDEGEAAGQAARRLADLRQRPRARGRESSSSPAPWTGTAATRCASPRRAAIASTAAPRSTCSTPTRRAVTRPTTSSCGHHGVRYTFDPCKTIKYVVNADDVGPYGIFLAQLGMAQLSRATGIKVKYIGTSHQIPFQTDETRLPAQPGPADRLGGRGRAARVRHRTGHRLRRRGPVARRARRPQATGCGRPPRRRWSSTPPPTSAAIYTQGYLGTDACSGAR